MIHLGTKSHL